MTTDETSGEYGQRKRVYFGPWEWLAFFVLLFSVGADAVTRVTDHAKFVQRIEGKMEEVAENHAAIEGISKRVNRHGRRLQKIEDKVGIDSPIDPDE